MLKPKNAIGIPIKNPIRLTQNNKPTDTKIMPKIIVSNRPQSEMKKDAILKTNLIGKNTIFNIRPPLIYFNFHS